MLKQKKPMTRKLSIALFISLLVLTPLISILSPALSKNAYADNGSAFNEVLLRAQAWSIINSFLYYSGGDGSRPISNLNIKNDTSGNAAQSCDIWSAGGYVVVGDYVTGKFGHSFGTNKPYQTWDNMQEGQGLANANNALKAAGFDGCQGLLVAAGANPDMKHNDDMDRSKMKANLQKVIDAKDSRFFFGAKLGDSSPGLAIEYAILRYGVQNECGWSLAADQETNRPQAEANGSNGDNDNQYYVAYTVEEGQTQSTKNVFFMGQDYPADFSGGEDLIQIGTYKYFADMKAGSGWSLLRSAVLSYGGTGQAYFYCSGDTSYGNRLGDSKYADAYATLLGTLSISDKNLCKPDDTTCTPDSSSTCKIQGGLGWLICPAMSFMATVTSQMYNWIANVLTINPKLFDTSMGTYTAWKMFRDYANIAFVIAFILIMYSQITSVGITNYGIKKMLPKLIIAAILVNISFYVCSLAVDLFNLLGWSVYHLFDGASGTVLSKAGGSGISTSYNDIASWVVGALAIGTVLVVALAAGILAPALIAVLLVFGILLLRQALVVMLIVISPLAIVAYILPNTEKLFRQWMSIFIKVLAVFPVVALVFGGSRLAANVISISNLPGVDSGVSSSGGLSASETMQGLIALGVMTIPFFVVPSLLKKSLEAAGSIGAKVSGLADKGVRKSMNSQSRLAKKNARAALKKSNRAARLTGQITAGSRAGRAWQRGRNRVSQISTLGGAGLIPKNLRTRGMQAGLDSINRSALSEVTEQESKDVQSAMIAMQSQEGWNEGNKISMAQKEFVGAMKNNDAVKARAAQQILLNTGNKGLTALHEGFDQVGQDANYSSIMSGGAGQKVLSDLNKANVKSKDAALAGMGIVKVDAGQPVQKISDIRNNPETYSKLSDNELATQGDLRAAISANAISAARAQAMLNPQSSTYATLSEGNRIMLRDMAGTSTSTAVSTSSLVIPSASETREATKDFFRTRGGNG